MCGVVQGGVPETPEPNVTTGNKAAVPQSAKPTTVSSLTCTLSGSMCMACNWHLLFCCWEVRQRHPLTDCNITLAGGHRYNSWPRQMLTDCDIMLTGRHCDKDSRQQASFRRGQPSSRQRRRLSPS